MQIKTILRSLLLAYALSGICLLLLALIVFKLDIGQEIVTVGILVIYVVSCLAGGFCLENSCVKINISGVFW